MKLYRKGVEVADIVIDEQTTFEWELQGGGLLSCDFTLPEMVEIKKNDYAIWRGRKFYAEDVIPVHKKKSNEFEYTFKMYDLYFFLKDAIHKFNDELDFYFYGDLRTQAKLLVDNFNRIGRATISLGAIPDTEAKNLKFADTDCESVLQQLCKEWGVEFILTESSLSFSEKIGNATGLTFKFKEGVRDIERNKVNDSSLVTKLYAFGGERNIPKNYGSKRLRIEAISKNTDKYGVVEGIKVFNDIYPHRTGVISALGDDICKFSDASLDFDINSQLIEGKSAKLTFTSGDLSGQEFEIHKYDHETKEFDIIKLTDSTGMEFPNANFKPKLGDKYVLHDIVMPDSYRVAAEARLRAKAQEFINKYSTPQCSYDITPDYVKLRRDAIELSVGDVLTVEDLDFNVSASNRIIGITQTIVSPFKYKIKVGDKATVSYLKRVLAKQLELDVALKIEKEDRQAEYRRTRRGLLQIEELQSSVFDQEGYFDTTKIKPLSIETNMLNVGSRNLRMSFEGLQIAPNYLSSVNSVKISASKLVHFTIEESVKEWNFLEQTINLADSTAYYYLYAKCNKKGTGGTYYATKEKLGLQDSTYYYFLIGVIHSAIDGVRGTSFQYGQTFINGKFITTGVVKGHTGKLVIDLDNGVVEVKNGGIFKGRFTFISGNENIDLATWAGNTEVSVQKADGKAQNALVKAAQVEADNEAKLKKLQEQIDNEISSYAYPYKPTASNYPASEWITEELKLRHDKDVFFNNKSFVDNASTPDAGKAWRWSKIGGVWEWNQIADSDTVKALKEASKAQAMADGKSTLFGFTPNTVKADGYCYREGDSWILNADKTVNGTAYKQGEILTATQDSTVFVESHWLKRIRYTDDTAVENLEIGGVNLLEGEKVTCMSASVTKTTVTSNNVKLTVLDSNDAYAMWDGIKGYDISESALDSPFTFSLKAKSNFSFTVRIMTYPSYSKEEFIVAPSSAFQKISVTAKKTNASDTRLFLYLLDARDTGQSGIVEFKEWQLERGNKATDYVINYKDLESKIEEAKQVGVDAQTAADTAQKSNASLQNYVNGAFEDNVLTTAEKKAIEKYKNTLNETMSKAEASYLKVYTNTYLQGAAKTSLSNAKINLWGQRDTLVTAINTALSSTTTAANIAARKTAIDSAFTVFNSKMKAFQEAIEGANKAIQDKLKADAEAKAKELVDAVEIGGRNLLVGDKFVRKSGTGVKTVLSRYHVRLTNISSSDYWMWDGIKGYDISESALDSPFTFSLKAKSNFSFTVRIMTYPSYSKEEFIVAPSSAFQKISLPTKKMNASDTRLFLYLLDARDTGQSGIVEFKEWQLEEGNKATSFSPAPEDLAAERDRKIAEASVRNFKVRYIRDWLNGSNKNAGNHWVEIQAYRKNGSNVAQGKSVTCSTGMLNTQRVTDNKFAEYAESMQNKLSNVVVDLGAAYSDITHVKVWHYFADSRTYKETRTEVSTDGETWFPIFDSLLQGTYTESSKGHKILVNASTAIDLANERIEKLRNDLDPTKQQADYLARALKKSTEVQGGLVLGSVIAVRDANGKVTAYFSGNRAINKAAFKAGVEHFGTQGETHNIALNHDATADLGALRVEKEGDIRVYDVDTKEERFAIIKKNIQSLAELQSASTFSLNDTGDYTHLNADGIKNVSNLSLTTTKAGGTLFLEGNVNVNADYTGNGIVYMNVALEVFRNGVSQGSIWSTRVGLRAEKNSVDTTEAVRVGITAEQGTYTAKLKVSTIITEGILDNLVSFSNPKFSWKLQAQNYRKINIGLDGLFATYPDKLLYFSAQEGLVVDGPTNMPGLLATGSVTANGNVSNLWGAKVNNVNTPSKVSQGRYRVPHNIGHSNYTISVMCHSVGVVATVGTKASSYFEFYMQKNGNYYDSGFDYVVYGRNY